MKPNNYPAVPLPNPGTSYNPDKEQHQDLLGEQLAKEVSYENQLEEDKRLPGGLTKKELFSQRVSSDLLSVLACRNAHR